MKRKRKEKIVKPNLSPNIINLVNILKEIGFEEDLVTHTNKYIIDRYKVSKKYGLTINEYTNRLEDDISQITTVVTNEISYFCVKHYLTFDANDLLMKKTNGFVRIVDAKEYLYRDDFEPFRDLAFDIIFEIGGVLVPFEIKVTQSTNNCFQGATHATSKVNDYLLISIDVNRDVVIEEGIKLVESIFMSMTNIDKGLWKGKPSSNNSRSTYKFSVYDSDLKTKRRVIDYSDGIICGALVRKQTYYHIVKKRLV